MILLNWLYLIVLTIFVRCFSIEGKTFFVSDYGAYSNDNIDDTRNIQMAVDAAIKYGLNSIINFGYGIYNLSDTINVKNATNLTITGQGIDQTWLIGNSFISIFSIKYCNSLTLTGFSIDFDPLPFTGGYVVQVNKSYIDVQVQTPHRADVDRQVRAILRYDPVHRRAAFGPNTYEIYQTPSENKTTSLVSLGVLRIPLNRPSQFLINDAVIVRYSFSNHSISAQDSTDVTIQSINTYTSSFMGIITVRVRRLNIIDYHVRTHKDRWMSTIVDCLHLTDSFESITILNSECQSMGDDGLNIHSSYFNVSRIINSTALIMETAVYHGLMDVGTGTHLEFSSSQQPFTVHTIGQVVSSQRVAFNANLIIFAQPIDANIGDWACLSDTPLVFIRNFTVANNRARGALLQSRNIDMRYSLFNRTSGPAVLFQPSLFWFEGPGAKNVTLSDNTYIHCNEGISQNKGMISILPDPIQLVQVINDIRIASSTFIFGNYSQGLLQSNNANNVYLTGNYIATNNSMALISICNSRNVTGSNNCLVNNQTTVNQIYVFDQTELCKMNLSSLIDLPRSAFNSSFPPPVFISYISID